jgi:hypothetical protein
MNTLETQTSHYIGLLVFRYPLKKLPEAYTRLAFSGRILAKEPGLEFFRYGGTGRHRGFSAQPDFTRFALFSVWKSREHWERFVQESPFVAALRRAATSLWYVSLFPLTGLGTWDGRKITCSPQIGKAMFDGKIAVLTRATIRLRCLRDFWSHVPAVSRQIETSQGCLYTLGFGELPWVRQATFSLWNSSKELKEFAYGTDGAHSVVVKRTKERGWYSEDMFCRFAVQGAATLVAHERDVFPQIARIS